MGGNGINYQSSNPATGKVLQFQFESLEKLTDGKYNRGELVLRNGEFAAVNNHVHLTLLNNTVTTKQENMDVRQAVFDLLSNHFVGLNGRRNDYDWSHEAPAMNKVRERLLGADNRMAPISRDEVRTMINMLKAVQARRDQFLGTKGASDKTQVGEFLEAESAFAEHILETSRSLKSDAANVGRYFTSHRHAGQDDDPFSWGSQDFGTGCYVKNYQSGMLNKNTVNVNAYREYAEGRESLSRTLGTVSDKLDGNQANELARLAFSRSRLYQEDGVFNQVVDLFDKSQVPAGVDKGDVAVRLFGGLREKIKRELAALDDSRLAEIAKAYGAKHEKEFSLDAIRKQILDIGGDFVMRLENELKSMKGVETKDGRVVDMEALIDRKSSVLKKAMLFLQSSSLVDGQGGIVETMLFDPVADAKQRLTELELQEQRQKNEIATTLKNTGAELNSEHLAVAQDLDAWFEDVQKLTGEDVQKKVDLVNQRIETAGAKMYSAIDTTMFKKLQDAEQLLDCKQQCVQMVRELVDMGFSDAQIVRHMEKELLLATDYGTAMQQTLKNLCTVESSEVAVEGKDAEKVKAAKEEEANQNIGRVKAKLEEFKTEIRAIRQKKRACEDCALQLKTLTQHGMGVVVKLDEFKTSYSALLAELGIQNPADTSSLARLSLELPAFNDRLKEREVWVNDRLNNILGALDDEDLTRRVRAEIASV